MLSLPAKERKTKFNSDDLIFKMHFEKHNALHNIVELQPKLIKLEISSEQIDRIKNSVLSS